jgi:Fanconi anemia group M protein
MEFLEKITPRRYQQKILETCVKKNCLVVLPTGLGKTLIALMLTIERMKEFPGERVVFLAPTRPLAQQHLDFFEKNLPELFGDMQLFTGMINPEERKKIWQTADIVFSTPQCVTNDLKKNLYNLKDVCLLIEDEAHRCIKSYDYNYIAQRYYKESHHPRILGLTASPGSEAHKIKEICKNLSIEEVELRTRASEDVKPYIQELKFEKIIIDLPPEFIKIKDALLKLFDTYISELRKRKVLWGPHTKSELIRLQKKLQLSLMRGNRNWNSMLAMSACAQAIKIQHALELLETQTLSGFNKYLKELFNKAARKENRGVVKLVAKPEFNYAFVKSNELLARGVENPKISKLRSRVEREKAENENTKILVFTQFRNTAQTLSKNLNKLKGIKAKVFVGQAKKIDGSGLSQKEQKQMIEEFSSKKINVLCATCIAEEGLDIPEVNMVVFYEPIPSAIRAIQRAGRTARLIEGKLIILIARKTRDEAYFYVSKAKEKRMHSAIDSIKKHLSKGKLGFQEELK